MLYSCEVYGVTANSADAHVDWLSVWYLAHLTVKVVNVTTAKVSVCESGFETCANGALLGVATRFEVGKLLVE